MAQILSPANPFRPPHWRWERAQRLARGRAAPPRRGRDGLDGHKWIRRAADFITRREQCTTDEQHEELAADCPDLYWAAELHANTVSFRKYSIEAHILARESDEEISYYFDLSPKVIKAYEALFFDVRSRLKHPLHVLYSIIKPHIDTRDRSAPHATLWKLYAYFMGPCVLQAMETGFIGNNWCDEPGNVSAALQDDIIRSQKLKASIAAKTIYVNSHNELAIIEQFASLAQIEQESQSGSRSGDQMMHAVAAMLDGLNISVGNQVLKNPRNPLREFDKSPVELRHEEMLRLSAYPHSADPALLSQRFPGQGITIDVVEVSS